MLKIARLCLHKSWAGVRALARDESGTAVIELGYCSVVLGLLIAGIYVASLFFKGLADDLREARLLIHDLI